MKINQLSIFLGNKPGAMAEACKVLADAGINLITLSLAEAPQFGILRVIVEDCPRALEAVKAAGFTAHITEVVAATCKDDPGGMASLLQVIKEANVNIQYVYAFAAPHNGDAVLVFRFDDPDKALAALSAAGRDVDKPIAFFGASKN